MISPVPNDLSVSHLKQMRNLEFERLITGRNAGAADIWHCLDSALPPLLQFLLPAWWYIWAALSEVLREKLVTAPILCSLNIVSIALRTSFTFDTDSVDVTIIPPSDGLSLVLSGLSSGN